MSIKAMRQALEALQGGTGNTRSWHLAIEDAIIALRTAIQQAEKNEPVLFVSPEQARAVTGKNRVHYTPSDNSGRYLPVRATPAGLFVQPLYTHPDPGVPDGWRIEEKGSDIIVRKYGFGGYSARKNTESIAEAVLHELALDLLAASPSQKG